VLRKRKLDLELNYYFFYLGQINYRRLSPCKIALFLSLFVDNFLNGYRRKFKVFSLSFKKQLNADF
jgi:hypothetical protein